MTYIEFGTHVKEYITRHPDPTDDWDIGDTEGYVENVTATIVDELKPYYGCSLGKEFPDSVGLGSTLYVVVADYTSGCTFGRTGAQGKILDAFEDPEEAMELAEAARAVKDYGFAHKGQMYSTDWLGYFEELQSLDVWTVTIGPGYARGVGFKRGH